MEDINDPALKQELLIEVLVELANFYFQGDFHFEGMGRSYNTSEAVSRVYLAVRDRYMKRPPKKRDKAVVSLLSVVLEEPQLPFSDLKEAYKYAKARHKNLRLPDWGYFQY